MRTFECPHHPNLHITTGASTGYLYLVMLHPSPIMGDMRRHTGKIIYFTPPQKTSAYLVNTLVGERDDSRFTVGRLSQQIAVARAHLHAVRRGSCRRSCRPLHLTSTKRQGWKGTKEQSTGQELGIRCD